jgi:hypothetical protein
VFLVVSAAAHQLLFYLLIRSDRTDGTSSRVYVSLPYFCSLPYTTVLYCTRSVTTTVIFRTLLSFTILLALQQEYSYCTPLSFTVLIYIRELYSFVLYSRLSYSCAYNNSPLPYSTVVHRTRSATTTVFFHTLPSFTILVVLQHLYSSILYCPLPYS